ncbi:MAG: hypothetical protein GYA33_05335 [Thermogutta sp.]|nr:hypothetical protein [Thermogutta sp.]
MRLRMKLGPMLAGAALLGALAVSAQHTALAVETAPAENCSRTWPSPQFGPVARPQPWYVLPPPPNAVFRGTPRFRWGDLGVERSVPQWSSRSDYYGRWKQWTRF